MITVGDCREVMAGMEPESIDAIVTDPPYDLVGGDARGLRYGEGGKRTIEANRGGFMGMRWDGTGVAFQVDTWREAFRVLKPGGHLLAFGGTRTFHRLTVAIEDAGFEIRDCLSYLYGSGFPKSLNVSKAIDKAAGAEREVVGIGDTRRASQSQPFGQGAKQDAIVDTRTITAPATDLARQWDGWGTALKPASESIVMARKPWAVRDVCGILVLRLQELVCQSRSLVKDAESSSASSPNGHDEASDSALWTAVAECNTPDDLFALMDTLPSEWVATSILSIVWSWLNTLAGIWTHASTFTTETASSLTTALRTLNSLLSTITAADIIQDGMPPNGGESSVELADAIFSGVWANLIVTLTRSVHERVTSPVDEQALRPDLEFITLARKPLCGTVARNVQQYGTGAINVDATRIAGPDGLTNGGRCVGSSPNPMNRVANVTEDRERSPEHALGRWPANVVLDEDAAALLDATVGERGNSWRKPQPDKAYPDSIFPQPAKDRSARGHADTGGPSRFFYTAKSSRSERNAGLEGMPEQSSATRNTSGRRFNPICDNTGKRIQVCNCGACSWTEATNPVTANPHPTVKPLSLMRWLVRLVTPPGGIVLDPFMGSGSTGCAAVLEGFQFIGIEQDADYAAIAERRIAYWAANGDRPVKAKGYGVSQVGALGTRSDGSSRRKVQVCIACRRRMSSAAKSCDRCGGSLQWRDEQQERIARQPTAMQPMLDLEGAAD